MFKGQPVILKYLKNFSAKSDFRVHHIFLDINRSKSFSSRNTCDCIGRFVAGAFHNNRTFILWAVGVADIDRDTFLTKRENSIFVQYSGSHISQFPEFFVCNCLNDGRIVYDTRICYQHTGNIGPVFIQICMDRFCNDRSRYIRTSTGKCLHTSIMERSIKSRDYCMIDSFQSFCQLFISHLIVQISVIFKENTFCRIHKCVTQIICHHDTVQEFSSGCCIVTSCLRNEVFLNLCKLFIQFQIQSQSVNNFLVSRLDFFDLSCNLFTFFSCPITFIEHVGYFNISIKTLSRC